MAESLSVDPAQLRESAAQLRQAAEDAERVANELKAALADEGEFWGDDEAGETFAHTYKPGADRTLEGFDDLVADIRAMSSAMKHAADAFEDGDHYGRQNIRNSAEDGIPSPNAPSRNRWAGPIPQATSSEPLSHTNDSARLPGTPDRPANGDSARRQPDAPNDRGSIDTQQPLTSGQQPEASGQQPAASGQQPAESGQQPPESGQQDDSTSNSPETESPEDESGDQPPAAETGSPTTPGNSAERQGRPANTPTGKQAGPPTMPSGRNDSGKPSADTPWTRNGSGTPWAKAPSPSGAPANETPPRVSPPRSPDRPPAGKKPEPAPKRPEQKRAPKPAGVRARRATDAEAMRIAREMAARHNIEIVGFDAAGIAAATVQDIADAADSVLPRMPAVLRGIEIRDVTGSLSAVENRCTAKQSGEVAPWIVLAHTAVIDPRMLAGRSRATTRSDPPRRPMYAAILRELGAVIDLTGGFRAHREAQRALITEYVRINDPRGETLSRVVAGYKRWRAQLGDNCFEQGLFVPGRALAEAFAAVESSEDEANVPQKVLGRLLVAMSRAALPDRQ
ncbi:WXG100 family type VII secretion target [Nocardia arthritidis]|uniref:WXG100 family type VII secretion target n=1 Tax=Nocardia arthritidis TaxID=228602 RepID=UPI0007A376E9|nr:WXG100 family type VII secretion target [Nocardia arthritidis]